MEPNNQPLMNDQNAQQVPPAAQPVPQNDKKVGPIIATLIIVLIVIFGALYIFASRITQPIIPDDTMPATGTQQTSQAEVKPVTSTSTDVNSLQSDLDTSTSGLDNQNF